MTAPTEVRIYFCNVDDRNFLDRPRKAAERIECHWSRTTRATWLSPGPVKFVTPPAKALQPFCDQRYPTVDDLVEVMRSHDFLITDYRKVVGTIKEVDHACALLDDDYVVESFKGDITLLKRQKDGSHGDIWRLADGMLFALKRCDLVTRFDTRNRTVYRQGPQRIEAISEKAASFLRKLSEVQEMMAHWRSPEFRRGTRVLPLLPSGTTTPKASTSNLASVRMRRAVLDRTDRTQSTVVAHDDEGNAITELDITRESNRNPPRGLPSNLVPDVDEDCSDREWEKLMLIEQIKFRRRTSASKGR